MSRFALLVALAGCNQVFDLEPTQLAAQTAPPVCPPLGSTLRFDSTVRQAIRQDCTGYTESADTRMALAQCWFAGKYVPAYGPADGPLDGITLATADPAETFPWPPVLSPEGDTILWSTTKVGQIQLATFGLSATGWQFTGYAPVPPAAPVVQPSAPSRAPHRHVLYFINGMLHEAAQDDAGAWSEVGAPYAFPVNANRPYLSPDGLRFVSSVVLSGGRHAVLYADRPTIDSRFGSPVELDAVPATADTFVREDCGRVYFSGLSNVLYEEQPR